MTTALSSHAHASESHPRMMAALMCVGCHAPGSPVMSTLSNQGCWQICTLFEILRDTKHLQVPDTM